MKGSGGQSHGSRLRALGASPASPEGLGARVHLHIYNKPHKEYEREKHVDPHLLSFIVADSGRRRIFSMPALRQEDQEGVMFEAHDTR